METASVESSYPKPAELEAEATAPSHSTLEQEQQQSGDVQIPEQVAGNTLSFFLHCFLYVLLQFLGMEIFTPNYYYYLTEVTLSEIPASSSKAVEVEACEAQPRYPEGPVTRQSTGSLPVPEPLQNISIAEELSSEKFY